MSGGERAHAKGGAYACFIWSLAAIAFGYAFFHRVTPAVMVGELMAEFAIGGAMLGVLSALYFYPYVLLQIPLGALLEQVGTRRLLSAALFLAAAGSVIFAFAARVEFAYLGRVFIGIGSSVGFLGSLALAAKWFGKNRFAFLAGLSMFTAMASGMLAQAPLAIYIDAFGWRSALLMLGAFGFVLATLVWVFVRNAPDVSHATPRAVDWHALWSHLKAASATLEVWKIAFVGATLAGPMLALGGLWGTPYLMRAFDLARPRAAFFMSLLLLGWAFGAPVCGWLSDRLGRCKPILIAGAAAVCVMLSAVIFLPDLPLAPSVCALVVVGFAGGAMTVSFALVRDVARTEISAAATGIVNSMTVASGAVLQPLVGLALDQLWRGEVQDGARLYLASDYRIAFGLILLTSLGGLIVACRLRETRAN